MKLEVGTLQELNVKPGDVVDYCGPETWCYKNGPFTVSSIDRNGWFLIDGITTPSDNPHWRIISRASTTTSPVRTVTRKEIVPGGYGRVVIDWQGGIRMDATQDADDLTQAIETLTAIRDALA